MKNTRFISGRDNLAATIYIPSDCPNKCAFCTSKKEYANGVNAIEVLQKVALLKNSNIPEVVITGGEPMVNISIVQAIAKVLEDKDIYINTSFIDLFSDEFIKFVNETDCIKAVNISRHEKSFEEDAKLLKHILPDDRILEIKKPVKINVVLSEGKENILFLGEVLNRWSEIQKIKKNLTVSFRANFNKIKPDELHIPDSTTKLCHFIGTFKHYSFCNVCDSMFFKSKKHPTLSFNYHKGFSTTAIQDGDTIEVNDIVIFPDGTLCYDWDRKTEHFNEFLDAFNLKPQSTPIAKLKQPVVASNTDNYYSRVRNASSCGLPQTCGGRPSSSSGYEMPLTCGGRPQSRNTSRSSSCGVPQTCGGSYSSSSYSASSCGGSDTTCGGNYY